jgi:DUF1680 family protein
MLNAIVLFLVAAPVGLADGPHTAREAFPFSQVRLLEGPFKEAQGRGIENLFRLDPERLLYTFRVNAGLPTTARPYGGWEAPDVELRGHSLGHYLSACALMYEATGDERLKARALGIVRALAQVQKALPGRGMHEGYLSAFPEEFFDRVEARKPVWAPYYTLHKILAGLLDVHRATGDATALALARGMADWVAFRAARLGEARWQEMLGTEYGGMEDALTELSVLTSEAKYLELARRFDQRSLFDPLARGEDPLDGLHANTQIPKAIGAALDCELTGERRYCAVADTFWRDVARDRSYVTGSDSDDEHFTPRQTLSHHLGETTAETCNTYNMLKLSHLLSLRSRDAEEMDFYERGLFNHILSSQDPETGMVTYHLPLRSGAWRTYSTLEDSFWCCFGTGMENPARYGEAIYSRDARGLYLDLFIASELGWPERGLVLRQETRFPYQQGTALGFQLEKPATLALRLRHPAWAAELAVKVNGKPVDVQSRPGTYAVVEREWHDGDRVEVGLPMRLHLEQGKDDPTVTGILFGPVVLAADLGTEGLTQANRYGRTAPEVHDDDMPAAPVLVAASPAEALARIHPGATPLSFRTEGLARPHDVELRPLFELYDRRYAVYFDLVSEDAFRKRGEEAAERAREEAEVVARTVDSVQAGVDEQEKAHALEEKSTNHGFFEGRSYRGSRWAVASFSYQLGTAGASSLRVTYWGGESRRFRFEVLVDGEPIAQETLFDDQPGEFYAVEYPLPDRVRGRESVRVGFRALPGSAIGAVYEVRSLRAAPPTSPGPRLY